MFEGVDVSTFLPDTLPGWAKRFVAAALLFHACIFLLYVALLCCSPAKPQPRITIAREKGQ